VCTFIIIVDVLALTLLDGRNGMLLVINSLLAVTESSPERIISLVNAYNGCYVLPTMLMLLILQ